MSETAPTIRWSGGADGHLILLDQTRLPADTVFLECRRAEDVWQAIKRLNVLGAPAIGVAAAYGVCVGVNEGREIGEVCDYLATSRPTAVNLFWALQRMRGVAREPSLATASPERPGPSLQGRGNLLAERLLL